MQAPVSSSQALPPFQLAFPVRDLDEARRFYGGLLGCSEGRSSSEWVDFDFYGHQIVAHLSPQSCGDAVLNAVDGHGVPVRHFGVVTDLGRRVHWRDDPSTQERVHGLVLLALGVAEPSTSI